MGCGGNARPSSQLSTETPSLSISATVQLSWGASPSGAVGYRVYRSETSGASYTPLLGAPFNALTYADTTVVSGTTYYYVVTSVDAAGGESAYSNQVKAVVPSP